MYAISTFDGNAEKGGDNLAVINAGVPNITGVTGAAFEDHTTPSGAFYLSGNAYEAENGGYGKFLLNFDASRSNSIYGTSDTVQPPALTLIPQIKY